MVRSLGSIVACLIVASLGCQRPQGGVDPFLGRTTIPAPGTGTPGDQYYSGANPVYPSPATRPPSVQFPPAGAAQPMPTQPSTGTPSLQQPPGGYQPPANGLQPPPASYYQGSSYQAPAAMQETLTEMNNNTPPRLRPVPQFDTSPVGSTSAPANASNSAVVTIDGTEHNPVVQVSHQDPSGSEALRGQPLELASNVRVPTPRLDRATVTSHNNSATINATRSTSPRPTPATGPVTVASSTVTGPMVRRSSGTTDIADLPPVHSSAVASAGLRHSGSQFSSTAKPASQTGSPIVASASARTEASGNVNLATYEEPVRETQAANYGHAADYSWLKGRLEYSASRKEWKLRYLRIDGAQTDQYGGSVVLSSSNLLQSFQPGEYVTVQGRIAGEAGGAGSFAPNYNVTRVERQQ